MQCGRGAEYRGGGGERGRSSENRGGDRGRRGGDNGGGGGGGYRGNCDDGDGGGIRGWQPRGGGSGQRGEQRSGAERRPGMYRGRGDGLGSYPASESSSFGSLPSTASCGSSHQSDVSISSVFMILPVVLPVQTFTKVMITLRQQLLLQLTKYVECG
ncbi:keratin, type I cytoskeletal 9-like isoform X3 [Teleopsis dalmanni]|uniref:keratin, type I cytoskeletal 9-like isoform X3 n=1 Tax=Teleopsis dalmanni TaxID=139649 RepID=UPI0018CF8634|nr:keratin, type I cytoskeletal 9-like isoform X3 [Teleopsis dalmanni]XP_037958016.1 keratin, type I cytoskeletal 9-like isoform X3 [Teleopsis dalmanni]